MSLHVFLVAFVVSFIGSIPPGAINITCMQLSVLQQKRAAFFLAFAASLIEFFYAGATVWFAMLIVESSSFTKYFQLVTALAMLILGYLNLRSKSKSRKFMQNGTKLKGRNGFHLGMILGVLNPLTVPYWLAVTTYLQSNQWITLHNMAFWWYVAGISSGTFVLLLFVNKLGTRFTHLADNDFFVHKIPGIVFISLGLYNLIVWLF